MGIKVIDQMLKHSFVYSVAFAQPFTIFNDLAPIENNNLVKTASASFDEEQGDITKLSYYENRLDESFQLLTENTVQKLQSSNHVPLSSKVNSENLKAINWEDKETDLEVIDPITNDITFGEESIDVKLVQEVLSHYNYYDGDVDSIYGPLTKQAIKDYKQDLAKEDSELDEANVNDNVEVINDTPEKTKTENTTKTKKLEVTQNNTTIISHAKDFLGTPYVWGGTNPDGFDCSGYIQYLYEEQNITIPRTVRDIWNFSTPITSPSIGDLVFFETYEAGPSHMGIYLGNDEFIHAGTSSGVTISNLKSNEYWHSKYIGAKRIE